MAAEDNKAIVHRYVGEVWNERNVEALGEFYPDTDIIEREGLPSLEDFKEYVRRVQAGFPDLSVTIDDMIAEEDRVAVRTTWRGTYEGEPIADVPPTGRSMTLSGNVIWRITDGKIVETWGIQDEELVSATRGEGESVDFGETEVMRYLEMRHLEELDEVRRRPSGKCPFWRC